VPGLHERRGREPALQVLDVREDSEWRERRISGSMHVPYHDIHELPPGLDPARAVAVICGSGQRSAVAASLVQRLGALDVIHVVDGGVGTWARAGYEIEE
jgi:rhodanese-related sulfurtransferase